MTEISVTFVEDVPYLSIAGELYDINNYNRLTAATIVLLGGDEVVSSINRGSIFDKDITYTLFSPVKEDPGTTVSMKYSGRLVINNRPDKDIDHVFALEAPTAGKELDWSCLTPYKNEDFFEELRTRVECVASQMLEQADKNLNYPSPSDEIILGDVEIWGIPPDADIIPTLVIDAEINPVKGTIENSIPVTVTMTNKSEAYEPIAGYWDFGDGEETEWEEGVPSAVHDYDKPGTYYLVLHQKARSRDKLIVTDKKTWIVRIYGQQ